MILYDKEGNKYIATKSNEPNSTCFGYKMYYPSKVKNLDFLPHIFWKLPKNYYFEYDGQWYRIPNKYSTNNYYSCSGKIDREIINLRNVYGIDALSINNEFSLSLISIIYSTIKVSKEKNKALSKYKDSHNLNDALSILSLYPEICFLFDATESNFINDVKECYKYSVKIKEKSSFLIESLLNNMKKIKLIDLLIDGFDQKFKKIVDFHSQNNKNYQPQNLYYKPDNSYKIYNSILIFLFPYIMWEFEKQFSMKKIKRDFLKKLFIYYVDYFAINNGVGNLIDINRYPINSNYHNLLQAKKFTKKMLHKTNEDIKHLISHVAGSLFGCYSESGHWMMLSTQDIVAENLKPLNYVILNTIHEFSSLKNRQ